MTTIHLCTPCLVCKLHLKGTASSLQWGPTIRYWRAEFLLRLSDVNTTIYSPVKSAPKSECPLFLRADITWSASFSILRPALSFLPAAMSSPLSWNLSLWDFKTKDHINPSFLQLFLPEHFITAIERKHACTYNARGYLPKHKDVCCDECQKKQNQKTRTHGKCRLGVFDVSHMGFFFFPSSLF